MYEVTTPLPSVVLLIWIPPSAPTMLVPFLSSIILSSTWRILVLRIVWSPWTIKSPSIVTVLPSSVIILFANWALPSSHFNTLLPPRLLAFFNLKSEVARRRPLLAVKLAPVSLLTELIVISTWPLPFVVWVIVVAPDCLRIKSPAFGAIGLPLLSLPSLVTVLVSVLSIRIVFPVWLTTVFPPRELPASIETCVDAVPVAVGVYVPVDPPRIWVTVSVDV